jgi:hypothetical protein
MNFLKSLAPLSLRELRKRGVIKNRQTLPAGLIELRKSREILTGKIRELKRSKSYG